MADITLKRLLTLNAEQVRRLSKVGPVDQYLAELNSGMSAASLVHKNGKPVGVLILRSERMSDGTKEMVMVAATMRVKRALLEDGLPVVAELARRSGHATTRCHAFDPKVAADLVKLGGEAIVRFKV